MLKLVCMHCGKAFEGNMDKFCSQSCKDVHIVELAKRIRKAMQNNPSHTERFSRL